MATVVKLGPDRTGELIAGAIFGFLSGFKDKRLDGLQTELMKEMSEAPDEATAAAFLGDERYTAIVGDPERFNDILKGMNAMQPGFDTLFGYDESGNRVPFSVKKGERLSEESFSSLGLHSQPRVPFYLSGDKEEEIPELIGNFRSRGEAESTLEERGLDLKAIEGRILNQASAQFEGQFAVARATQRRAEVDLLLRQDRFNLDKNRGTTVFSNLIHEFSSGNLTAEQFQTAWDRVTTLLGRTAGDLAADSIDDLTAQAAMVENASRLGKKLVEKVIADPRLIAKGARGLASFGADFVAEVDALINLAGGRPDKKIDDFEWGGLAAESAEFKGMLFDMAIISLQLGV